GHRRYVAIAKTISQARHARGGHSPIFLTAKPSRRLHLRAHNHNRVGRLANPDHSLPIRRPSRLCPLRMLRLHGSGLGRRSQTRRHNPRLGDFQSVPEDRPTPRELPEAPQKPRTKGNIPCPAPRSLQDPTRTRPKLTSQRGDWGSFFGVRRLDAALVAPREWLPPYACLRNRLTYHRAEDTRLGRIVTLKFLSDDLRRDPLSLATFLALISSRRIAARCANARGK